MEKLMALAQQSETFLDLMSAYRIPGRRGADFLGRLA